MDRIVIIDGNSILEKAFYHVPLQVNSSGFHINAICGFLNVLFRTVDEQNAQYLTIVFGKEETADNPMPESYNEQLPVIKELLAAMKVNVVESSSHGADSIMGSIAERCENGGVEPVIVSGSQNIVQSAADKTKAGINARIIETKNKKTEITDFVKNETLPAEAAGDEKNVTVDFSLGNAKRGELLTPEAYTKIQQLSITDILDKEVLDKMGEAGDAPKINIDEDIRLVEVRTRADAEKIFETAAGSGSAAIRLLDIKATDAGAYGAQADGQMFLQFEEEKEIFGCLLCGGSDTEENAHWNVYWIESSDEIPAPDIRQWIGKLLSAGNMTVSTFDVKNDYGSMVSGEQDKTLSSHEITKNIFDCKIAAYLVNPLKSDYKIEDVAEEYLNIKLDKWADIFGKTDVRTAFKNSRKQCLAYLVKEAFISYKAAPALEKALRLNGMEKLFRELEMPLTYVLFDMEREGILVKPEELKRYGEALSGRIGELEKEIHAAAGEVFNINSPKQLGEILFEKMKLPEGKKTKTGYSTAADVLEKLAPEYPIVKDILEYRGLAKLKSTYAEGLAAFINKDNKIHTNFNQTITATGRLSSTEPNLQNIPMRMELGRRIRKVFIPQEGCIFMDADYSQIELRVLAHMSDDKQLIEAYKMDEDIHRITASKVFHTPFGEVTDLQRRNAKAVNFGIVYGISSFGLSQDLSITTREAKTYIDEYFKTYPGIKRFLDKMVEDAKEKGYCETMFGRRRPVPELKSSNFNQRSFGERVAMNSPIQGTAADIIKYAMLNVYDALKREGLKSKLILQIHDELLIETRNDEVEKVREILSREMQNACKLAVNLEIDLHTGADWYEAK